MDKLRYTVIKNPDQYHRYSRELERLLVRNLDEQNPIIREIIELLTLLIEKWDEQHNPVVLLDPVELVKFLMKKHNMLSIDLARVLNVSKSLVSSILHYRRGFSKENIRILSDYFKVSQEAFNRYYPLVVDGKSK